MPLFGIEFARNSQQRRNESIVDNSPIVVITPSLPLSQQNVTQMQPTTNKKLFFEPYVPLVRDTASSSFETHYQTYAQHVERIVNSVINKSLSPGIVEEYQKTEAAFAAHVKQYVGSQKVLFNGKTADVVLKDFEKQKQFVKNITSGISAEYALEHQLDLPDLTYDVVFLTKELAHMKEDVMRDEKTFSSCALPNISQQNQSIEQARDVFAARHIVPESSFIPYHIRSASQVVRQASADNLAWTLQNNMQGWEVSSECNQLFEHIEQFCLEYKQHPNNKNNTLTSTQMLFGTNRTASDCVAFWACALQAHAYECLQRAKQRRMQAAVLNRVVFEERRLEVLMLKQQSFNSHVSSNGMNAATPPELFQDIHKSTVFIHQLREYLRILHRIFDEAFPNAEVHDHWHTSVFNMVRAQTIKMQNVPPTWPSYSRLQQNLKARIKLIRDFLEFESKLTAHQNDASLKRCVEDMTLFLQKASNCADSPQTITSSCSADLHLFPMPNCVVDTINQSRMEVTQHLQHVKEQARGWIEYYGNTCTNNTTTNDTSELHQQICMLQQLRFLNAEVDATILQNEFNGVPDAEFVRELDSKVQETNASQTTRIFYTHEFIQNVDPFVELAKLQVYIAELDVRQSQNHLIMFNPIAISFLHEANMLFSLVTNWRQNAIVADMDNQIEKVLTRVEVIAQRLQVVQTTSPEQLRTKQTFKTNLMLLAELARAVITAFHSPKIETLRDAIVSNNLTLMLKIPHPSNVPAIPTVVPQIIAKTLQNNAFKQSSSSPTVISSSQLLMLAPFDPSTVALDASDQTASSSTSLIHANKPKIQTGRKVPTKRPFESAEKQAKRHEQEREQLALIQEERKQEIAKNIKRELQITLAEKKRIYDAKQQAELLKRQEQERQRQEAERKAQETADAEREKERVRKQRKLEERQRKEAEVEAAAKLARQQLQEAETHRRELEATLQRQREEAQTATRALEKQILEEKQKLEVERAQAEERKKQAILVQSKITRDFEAEQKAQRERVQMENEIAQRKQEEIQRIINENKLLKEKAVNLEKETKRSKEERETLLAEAKERQEADAQAQLKLQQELNAQKQYVEQARVKQQELELQQTVARQQLEEAFREQTKMTAATFESKIQDAQTKMEAEQKMLADMLASSEMERKRQIELADEAQAKIQQDLAFAQQKLDEVESEKQRLSREFQIESERVQKEILATKLALEQKAAQDEQKRLIAEQEIRERAQAEEKARNEENEKLQRLAQEEEQRELLRAEAEAIDAQQKLVEKQRLESQQQQQQLAEAARIQREQEEFETRKRITMQEATEIKNTLTRIQCHDLVEFDGSENAQKWRDECVRNNCVQERGSQKCTNFWNEIANLEKLTTSNLHPILQKSLLELEESHVLLASAQRKLKTLEQIIISSGNLASEQQLTDSTNLRTKIDEIFKGIVRREQEYFSLKTAVVEGLRKNDNNKNNNSDVLCTSDKFPMDAKHFFEQQASYVEQCRMQCLNQNNQNSCLAKLTDMYQNAQVILSDENNKAAVLQRFTDINTRRQDDINSFNQKLATLRQQQLTADNLLAFNTATTTIADLLRQRSITDVQFSNDSKAYDTFVENLIDAERLQTLIAVKLPLCEVFAPDLMLEQECLTACPKATNEDECSVFNITSEKFTNRIRSSPSFQQELSIYLKNLQDLRTLKKEYEVASNTNPIGKEAKAKLHASMQQQVAQMYNLELRVTETQRKLRGVIDFQFVKVQLEEIKESLKNDVGLLTIPKDPTTSSVQCALLPAKEKSACEQNNCQDQKVSLENPAPSKCIQYIFGQMLLRRVPLASKLQDLNSEIARWNAERENFVEELPTLSTEWNSNIQTDFLNEQPKLQETVEKGRRLIETARLLETKKNEMTSNVYLDVVAIKHAKNILETYFDSKWIETLTKRVECENENLLTTNDHGRPLNFTCGTVKMYFQNDDAHTTTDLERSTLSKIEAKLNAMTQDLIALEIIQTNLKKMTNYIDVLAENFNSNPIASTISPENVETMMSNLQKTVLRWESYKKSLLEHITGVENFQALYKKQLQDGIDRAYTRDIAESITNLLKTPSVDVTPTKSDELDFPCAKIGNFNAKGGDSSDGWRSVNETLAGLCNYNGTQKKETVTCFDARQHAFAFKDKLGTSKISEETSSAYVNFIECFKYVRNTLYVKLETILPSESELKSEDDTTITQRFRVAIIAELTILKQYYQLLRNATELLVRTKINITRDMELLKNQFQKLVTYAEFMALKEYLRRWNLIKDKMEVPSEVAVGITAVELLFQACKTSYGGTLDNFENNRIIPDFRKLVRDGPCDPEQPSLVDAYFDNCFQIFKRKVSGPFLLNIFQTTMLEAKKLVPKMLRIAIGESKSGDLFVVNQLNEWKTNVFENMKYILEQTVLLLPLPVGQRTQRMGSQDLYTNITVDKDKRATLTAIEQLFFALTLYNKLRTNSELMKLKCYTTLDTNLRELYTNCNSDFNRCLVAFNNNSKNKDWIREIETCTSQLISETTATTNSEPTTNPEPPTQTVERGASKPGKVVKSTVYIKPRVRKQ